MNSIDGVVYVHGYATEEFDAQLKSNEEVWHSRISQGFEVCELFESLGVSSGLVFLGGVDSTHGPNAERMREFAKEEYSERFQRVQSACVYEDEVDTEREVDLAFQHCESVGASFVVSVSNYDHTPRISRLWSQKMKDKGDSPIAFVSSSDGKYSKLESIADDANPFILEGAVFEPLIEVLDDELWDIDADEYDAVASDIREVLQEYTD